MEYIDTSSNKKIDRSRSRDNSLSVGIPHVNEQQRSTKKHHNQGTPAAKCSKCIKAQGDKQYPKGRVSKTLISINLKKPDNKDKKPDEKEQ